MRLLLVELTRLRWRRAVLSLVLLSVLIPAFVAWGEIHNTRPYSQQEVSQAVEQARANAGGDRFFERQVRQCALGGLSPPRARTNGQRRSSRRSLQPNRQPGVVPSLDGHLVSEGLEPVRPDLDPVPARRHNDLHGPASPRPAHRHPGPVDEDVRLLRDVLQDDRPVGRPHPKHPCRQGHD